jgi:transcriptional regulator with XRE-family HTH domain
MSNSVKALGEAIRARRNAKVLTQEALADAAGIKVMTLRNIEAGRTEHPYHQTIRKIASALGCEPDVLMPSVSIGLDRDMLALTSPPHGGPSPHDRAAFLAAQITRTDLMMDRRSAMKAAILAGASLLNPVERWLLALEQSVGHQPVRFAPERHHDIDKLQAAARTFRELRDGPSAGTFRTAVVALLNEVATLFEDGGLSTSAKERLYRVMADLAGVAAAMSWDCGLNRQAQEYYGLALHCAHLGGDLALATNVLAGMARQLIRLGHPHDGLALIGLAKQRVDRTTDPRVLAHLDTWEAWALAALARVPAFERAIMQAREHLAAAPASGGPYWIAYFDDSELAGVTGGMLTELARREPRQYATTAVAELSHAVQTTRVKTGQNIATDQIALAECYFLLGDTISAVQQTHQALNALEHTQSKRPLVRLGELFQQTEKAPRVRAVVDVQGRIQQMLKSRESMLA